MITTAILLFLCFACGPDDDAPAADTSTQVPGTWNILFSDLQFGGSNFDTSWVEPNTGSFTFLENGTGEYLYGVDQGGIEPLVFSSDFVWLIDVDSNLVIVDEEGACRSVNYLDETEMRVEMVWQSSYRTYSGTRFESHDLLKEE